MGAAAPALTVAGLALAVSLLTTPAAAESRCTGTTPSGQRFVTCFDLGNRLSFTAGTNGFGGAMSLRHIIRFDDEPDLVWRLEHQIAETTHAAFEDRFEGVAYRGRFIRHARDGHIVIPLGTPKKVFLPFDIGAVAQAGSMRWRPGSAVEIGVVQVGAIVDFSRARGFGRRFAIGPVARWDISFERADRPRLALDEHVVAPFTTGLAELGFESSRGLTAAWLRVEAGTAWSSLTGWQPEARAEASVERIMIAVNDRPISIVLGARYDSSSDEAIGRIGARIAIFDRRDRRVDLTPLTAAR